MKDNIIRNKICIIDDDDNILEIYKQKLEEENFLVYTAKDGVEGLELIKKVKPDLSLIDINMPKKDGVDLIKDIRKDGDISRTKIIILTNKDDLETVKKIEEYNVHFYIVKALTAPQKVADMVKEALV